MIIGLVFIVLCCTMFAGAILAGVFTAIGVIFSAFEELMKNYKD